MTCKTLGGTLGLVKVKLPFPPSPQEVHAVNQALGPGNTLGDPNKTGRTICWDPLFSLRFPPRVGCPRFVAMPEGEVVWGEHLCLFYDSVQSPKRLKEVAQRSGPPMKLGQTSAATWGGAMPWSLAEPRCQDHIREGKPWVQYPSRGTKTTLCTWHRNRGLLGLKGLLRFGQGGHQFTRQCTKNSSPLPCFPSTILFWDSCGTLRGGLGPQFVLR